MTGAYADAVEAKIEASVEVGGWAKGPAAICAEATEEAIDIAAWLRGLDGYPKPGRAEGLIDTIIADAALLYDAIRELGRLYGE